MSVTIPNPIPCPECGFENYSIHGQIMRTPGWGSPYTLLEVRCGRCGRVIWKYFK